jgi:hypothetical protein
MMKRAGSNPVSLWSILERLQRRLEDQGLPSRAADAVIEHALLQLARPAR